VYKHTKSYLPNFSFSSSPQNPSWSSDLKHVFDSTLLFQKVKAWSNLSNEIIISSVKGSGFESMKLHLNVSELS
jgi:hypothetical protein